MPFGVRQPWRKILRIIAQSNARLGATQGSFRKMRGKIERELQMTIKSLQELVYHFQPEREARPIILLGAGASFRSGVPVVAEMVRQIARFSYAIKILGQSPDHATGIMEGDIQRHLQQQAWYKEGQPGEMFPHAVEELLTPSSVRRMFFSSMVSRAKGPTDGHFAIADMVQRQLVRTILTTNFDSLIEDALKTRQPHIKEVVVLNKAEGDLAAFSPYNMAQVVYLHGAFEYYRDRNSIDETKRMDDGLASKVRHMISYAPLVVIGYRGYEPSVMHHLLGEGIKDSNRYANGIFWCVRNPADIHANVHELANHLKSNFTLIQIAGFDEAMVELNSLLSGRAAYQSKTAAGAALEGTSVLKTIDLQVRNDLSMNALESDQLLAMASQYATKILKTEIKTDELERFLEAYSFAKRDEKGILRPTLGLYLLVGKDVTDRNPHLKTTVLVDGKQQIVFPGNLLKQFNDLRAFLLSEDINPVLRIKRPEGAVELKSYHERAIVELLVNFMAHRDYGSKELGVIEYQTGQHLCFRAPGGLPESVHQRLQPLGSGIFKPQRNVREVRNPVISDVFFSQGIMDKAGTGLIDVIRYMDEHYGATEFSISDGNRHVHAKLIQAQSSGDVVGKTAHPVGQREIFLTNLFPFLVLPSTVFTLPLDPQYAAKDSLPLFPEGIDEPAKSLVFVRQDGSLSSFGDFRKFKDFAKRVGYLDYMIENSVGNLLSDPDKRRLFVQLLGRHWERYLRGKAEYNFFVDYKARRAFFLPKDGEDNVFTYDSPQRKNITRAVVKKRDTPTRLEFENEGITYSVVQFGVRWAIQTKPFYVFTKSDGKTPLPGIRQTQRATRRYKFDRNKAVEADMKFWSLFLAGQKSTMDLGGPTVSDLVLSASYLEAEAMEL